MPRVIDSNSRTEAMVLGVNRVLVDRGVFGLTLRAIAAESGISSGSLLHHFESRERVLRVAAHRTGLTLVRAVESDGLWDGVAAFLPGDDEMVLLTRAWLAWCELWRSVVCAQARPMPPERARELLRSASTAALTGVA
jgi:AcrR family transcriptional regulator